MIKQENKNYELTKEVLENYRKQMKADNFYRVDVLNGTTLKDINSFMDYLMNEIIMEEVDKYLKAEKPDIVNKYKWREMSYRYDENSNVIRLDIHCYQDINKNVDDEILSIGNDIKIIPKGSEVSIECSYSNEYDSYVNKIFEIEKEIFKEFSQELVYIISAFEKCIKKMYAITEFLINSTTNYNNLTIGLSLGNGISLSVFLKEANIKFIDQILICDKTYSSPELTPVAQGITGAFISLYNNILL